ncbi:MAG: sulfatase, partial [Saprospirales bacterium TMED214]
MSRRRLLQQASSGFGGIALAGLLAEQASHGSDDPKTDVGGVDHPARAKHVIFCYMSGGVSHVDSFDPKPKLKELHGKSMPVNVERTQFNNNGSIMASPFKFQPWGESGLEISDMFPNVGKQADELAVIRSLTSPVNEHAQGNFLMHSGFPFMGHPTAGAWCSYGLGSANKNLPAYVVLQSGGAVPPHGGVALFSNGFLPAQHQGSILKADKEDAIRNIRGIDGLRAQQRRLELARALDGQFLKNSTDDPQVEAAIANFETAFRMQTAIPELCDI